MKQYHGALFFALLTLFSCGDSEQATTNSPSPNLIELSVEVASQTKGTPIEQEWEMATLGLYCAHTADESWSSDTTFDKMNNRELYYDSEQQAWCYAKQSEAWDNSSITDKYTFAGYSPYDSSSTIINSFDSQGVLWVEYNTPLEYALQPDLMLSTPLRDIYPQVGSSVQLDFKHVLSAISFSVKGASDNYITQISLSNIISSGTVCVEPSGDVVWDNLSESSEQEFGAGVDTTAAANADDATPLTLDDGYLMVIPQNCEGIEVRATIYNKTKESYVEKTFTLSQDEQWLAGQKYNYTINIGTYDYTIEGTANCYMLHPDGAEQIFYIPVEGRINTFWRDYADSDGTYSDKLSSTDEWRAEILWHDVEGGIDGFSAERVTVGYSPSESVTAASSPDFTTIGANSAMKITLGATLTEGNILIAVLLDDEILWSWHLWITDYDPDTLADRYRNRITSSRYIYSQRQYVGAVHRYEDGDIWSGLYAERFIMDRNLGARSDEYATDMRGVLHYQFGRKEPFAVVCSQEPETKDSQVSFIETVHNPTTFYNKSKEPYGWCTESQAENDKYLWYDKNVPNDPNTTGKSIFDPSPLGWKVPRNGTYTIIDTTNTEYSEDEDVLKYMESIYFPMTGFRSNSSGEVKSYGSQGNLRLSTLIDQSFAYNFAYNPNVDKNTNNTISDGFCVRCVEE